MEPLMSVPPVLVTVRFVLPPLSCRGPEKTMALFPASAIVFSGPLQLSGGNTNLTVTNTGGTLISGSIGGTGVLNDLAPTSGTQTTLSLSGNNGYTGQTNIMAG